MSVYQRGMWPSRSATWRRTPMTDRRFVLKWPMPRPVMTFSMPNDAVVIDVRTQDEVPTLWTLSSMTSPVVERTFEGFGTGHPIDDPNCVYVGSAHDVEGDRLVFHIFERKGGTDAAH